MGEELDLVWRTAKSQLYLSEAAQVKKLVGPERIRRNKDALRELRCFQEILGDLHAGHFGRAPERHRAAEEAALRWEMLKSEAQRHGLKAEDLCAPSGERLLSYVQCVGSVGSPGVSKLDLESGLTICASTRAPSTALDALDEQSFATAEMVSEITSMVDDITWHATTATARKKRQNTELKKLAIELTEQLDQEYTALMASIEEIQVLMEAELAGDARLPSVEDLEEFAKQINVALSTLEAPMAAPSDASDAITAAVTAVDAVRPQEVPKASLEAVLEISDVFQETPPEVCPPLVAPVPAVLVPLAERQWRPRWADLASDSDSEPRKEAAAEAPCARCQRSLTRSSFSRRAWRQVRGKGALGERKSDNAWCRQCAESFKG